MTEAASASSSSTDSAAQPSAPAPNAQDTGASSETSGADGEEAAPDPEAELEAHVRHALKSGKRKEAAEKAKETKAAKKPSREPTLLATKAELAEASKEKDEPEAEPEPTEKPARSGKTARQLLDAGDIEGAFEAAFGKKPQDFNINSKRWAEYRKVQQRDRAKLAEAHQQFDGIVARARQEAAELLPMRQARQLYESGDIEGAVKLAFGDDTTGFNRKLLGQFHGKNPEVDSVRAELRALKEERERERREYAQQLEQSQKQQAQQQFVAEMVDTIQGSDDPQLVALGKKRWFQERVYQTLAQHYDPSTRLTLPVLEAADMVRQAFIDENGDLLAPRDAGAPAVSVRAGSSPAKPAARAATTISQSGAAETSAPPRGAHGKSLDEQVRDTLRDYGQTG